MSICSRQKCSSPAAGAGVAVLLLHGNGALSEENLAAFEHRWGLNGSRRIDPVTGSVSLYAKGRIARQSKRTGVRDYWILCPCGRIIWWHIPSRRALRCVMAAARPQRKVACDYRHELFRLPQGATSVVGDVGKCILQIVTDGCEGGQCEPFH